MKRKNIAFAAPAVLLTAALIMGAAARPSTPEPPSPTTRVAVEDAVQLAIDKAMTKD